MFIDYSVSLDIELSSIVLCWLDSRMWKRTIASGIILIESINQKHTVCCAVSPLSLTESSEMELFINLHAPIDMAWHNIRTCDFFPFLLRDTLTKFQLTCARTRHRDFSNDLIQQDQDAIFCVCFHRHHHQISNQETSRKDQRLLKWLSQILRMLENSRQVDSSN